jgi:hypothetical protein
MDKMTKLLVAFVLAFVICTPELSYTQPQEPVDVTSELENIFKELIKLRDEIAEVQENTLAISADKELDELNEAGLSTMETARWMYEYFISALVWRDCTRADCEPLWRPTTITQLRRAKTYLNEVAINRLHQAFMKGTISEASNKLIIARDIIRSSLPLIDRLIQILESEQERVKTPDDESYNVIFKMIK